MRVPRLVPTLAWLVRRALPGNPVLKVRAQDSGLVFFVHARDVVGRHLAKYGRHEPAITAFIQNSLSRASGPGAVIDIGANIGWHALHAARAGNVSAVVACEPDPFNAMLLDRALMANGIDNVILAPWAVGAQRGHARLNRYKPSNLGRHSIAVDHGFGSRTVPVLDLDATMETFGLQHTPVHLMKIDVEGYELKAVRGAQNTLARTAAIVLEHSPELMRAAGMALEELIERLTDAGFSSFALADGGAIEPFDHRRLATWQGQIDLVWEKQT